MTLQFEFFAEFNGCVQFGSKVFTSERDMEK